MYYTPQHVVTLSPVIAVPFQTKSWVDGWRPYNSDRCIGLTLACTCSFVGALGGFGSAGQLMVLCRSCTQVWSYTNEWNLILVCKIEGNGTASQLLFLRHFSFGTFHFNLGLMRSWHTAQTTGSAAIP